VPVRDKVAGESGEEEVAIVVKLLLNCEAMLELLGVVVVDEQLDEGVFVLETDASPLVVVIYEFTVTEVLLIQKRFTFAHFCYNSHLAHLPSRFLSCSDLLRDSRINLNCKAIESVVIITKEGSRLGSILIDSAQVVKCKSTPVDPVFSLHFLTNNGQVNSGHPCVLLRVLEC
jgi:hypothetical protein